MKINESKTKAVIFTTKNKQLPPHADIVLNGRSIEIVDHFKSLGVVFSANMSWDNHVNVVIQKCARITGIVGRLKHLLSTQVKLLIYNTLFCSYLNYCVLVWGTTTFSNLQKIHKIQKKFIRFTYNVPYGSPTADLFSNSHIVSIHQLYFYRLSVRFKFEIKENLECSRQIACLEERKQSYEIRGGETWMVPAACLNSSMQRLCQTLPCLLNHYISIILICFLVHQANYA